MFEKLKFCWHIFIKSSNVVNTHKKLILFPLFSTAIILCGIATALYICTTLVISASKVHDKLLFLVHHWVYFVVLLLIYLAVTIFATACNISFFSEVFEILKGRKVSIRRGSGVAFSRAEIIFLWAIVDASIGVIISMLSFSTTSKTENFLMFNATNITWETASYFAIPAMCVKREITNPFKLIAYSSHVLQKTWGVSVCGFIGLSSLKFVATLLWLGIVFIAIGIYGLFQTPIVLILSAGMIGVALLLFVMFTFYVNMVQKIYQAGVFAYATGHKIDFLYNKTEITNAFTKSR